MKTITKVLMLAIFSVALSSCSKEKSTAELILGKWIFNTQIINNVVDGGSYSNTYTRSSNEYITFASDGTFSYYINSNEGTGSYTINETQITLNFNYITSTATIRELTKNSLHLYFLYKIDDENYTEEIDTFEK
jgi:hypothetical protein